MSESAQAAGSRLTLDLWHPNCWAIEATHDVPGGILAHAIYNRPAATEQTDEVNGLFTAFGETTDEVETLLEHVEDRGVDPMLVLEELQADASLQPAVAIGRRRSQLEQLMG